MGRRTSQLKNDALFGKFLEEHGVLWRHTAPDRATQKALRHGVTLRQQPWLVQPFWSSNSERMWWQNQLFVGLMNSHFWDEPNLQGHSTLLLKAHLTPMFVTPLASGAAEWKAVRSRPEDQNVGGPFSCSSKKQTHSWLDLNGTTCYFVHQVLIEVQMADVFLVMLFRQPCHDKVCRPVLDSSSAIFSWTGNQDIARSFSTN